MIFSMKKLLFAGGFAAALTVAWAHPEALEVGPDNTHDLPTGKEADGIIGDFVLRNHQVQAVVSGNLPLRRANMSTFYGTNGITPGCLYDLTFRTNGNDQITIFSPCEQRGPVSFVRIVPGDDAVVECVTTAANNDGLYKRHEYRVDDASPGVFITTTLRNESTQVRTQKVNDRWTTFTGTNRFGSYRWVNAVDPADRTGYAFRNSVPAGATKPTNGVHEIKLEPKQELQIKRFLAVGRSPAEAIGRVAENEGGSGTLSARVRDINGYAVAGATLRIRSEKKTVPAYADENGRLNIPFPTGKYEIRAEDGGREATEYKEVEIARGGTANLEFQVSARSMISLQITDRDGRDIPCKAQFIGIDGTRSPNLGPANRAHGCKDQYHSETGQIRVPVPAGKYRVIVTRGIEYSHLIREVEVGSGAEAKVVGQLERLVDTRGWVSADYHNHSTPSGDNTCGTDDRIINLVAEHIEFAPTTEHNRLYDWRPHIEKLGLTRHLQTVSGLELTGSGPHLNSFPFHPHPHTQDNGAPVWNRDPRISAILLRSHQKPNPDRWIQINHPNLIENFIDHNDDGLADGGYIGLGQLIDGVEVQNFRVSSILAKGVPIQVFNKTNVVVNREFLWLQLLNRGHRLVAMAVSDAHSIHGNGVGGWRMYMPSRVDEPPEIDWRENSRHAKAGRSILTTGPFLEVQTTEFARPGADVRASGSIDLEVKVQCTDWIDVNRVQVLVNGRPKKELNFTRESHPDMFRNGVTKFFQTIKVPLSEDAHLIVVAINENKDLSLGYGTSDQAKLHACAYNNPIFVDVDGGGFKANGDMLDYPLGVGKFTPEEAKKLLGN